MGFSRGFVDAGILTGGNSLRLPRSGRLEEIHFYGRWILGIDQIGDKQTSMDIGRPGLLLRFRTASKNSTQFHLVEFSYSKYRNRYQQGSLKANYIVV